jgi:rare lipoprotein A
VNLGLLLAGLSIAAGAGAQQASDKPSPVPRRPARPKAEQAESARSRAADGRERGGGRPRAVVTDGRETGTACFFSSKANGRPTASGDHLDSEELVAAHGSFPFGSRVRVTNLANGKAVVVRIIDRFPDPKRIISVSEAAAREIGLIKTGTAQVELTVVEEDGEAARE